MVNSSSIEIFFSPVDSRPTIKSSPALHRFKKALKKIVVQHPEPQIDSLRSALQQPEAQTEATEPKFTPRGGKRSRRELRRHLH